MECQKKKKPLNSLQEFKDAIFLRGSTLLAVYTYSRFLYLFNCARVIAYATHKVVSPSPVFIRLAAVGGLSVKHKNDATCLYVFIVMHSPSLCQLF